MASSRILGSLLLTIFVIGKCSAESGDVSNLLKDVVNAHAFTTEQKMDIQNLKNSKNGHVRLHQDCNPLSRFGRQPSGLYVIKPKNSSPLLVYCDMENEDGGWILVQRVVKGSTIPFQKTWSEYETTFGDINSNYWLGSEHIYRITEQQRYEVMFIFEHDNKIDSVKFDSFNVDGKNSNYALRLGAPHNMSNLNDYYKKLLQSDNMMFSTYDRDNDRDTNNNCAQTYEGGWWFNSCSSVTFDGQPTLWRSICPNCDSITIYMKRSYQNCVINRQVPK